jgi:hypothetical protein
MKDLFSEPGFQHRDPKVEAFLLNEGWRINLVELSDTVLASIDISKFQTRDVIGRNNFVDDDRVANMSESLEMGQPLPGVVLFLCNGKYIMCDGRHRIETYRATKSKTFWAYVISEDDEAKVASNAIRLSNLLNEMNGERAGQSIEEKNQRNVQVELCAQSVFSQVNEGVDRDKALEHGLLIFKIKKGSGIADRVKSKIAQSFVSIYMAESCSNAIESSKMLSKLSMSYIDHVEDIFSKAENPDRIRLTNTIFAAQKKLFANGIREILCHNKNLRVSEIIKILREKASLTDDDRELNPEEEARHNRMRDRLDVFGKFWNIVKPQQSPQQSLEQNLFGEDRKKIVNGLEKIIPAAQAKLKILKEDMPL